MKYETRFEVLKLADLVAPPYNPREDVERGSDEYNALRRSIQQHGMVEPRWSTSTICAASEEISALLSCVIWGGWKCSAP